MSYIKKIIKEKKAGKKLDIKLDVIFKLFFSEKENAPLLIAFLEAVLKPESRIEEISISNPIMPIDLLGDKAPVLDIVVVLKNKTKIDVEMQMGHTLGFRERILYYWAKLYQGQSKVSEDYTELFPTVSICVLNYNEFPENTKKVHTQFKLKEIDEGFVYNNFIDLHFIELTKFKKWYNLNRNTEEVEGPLYNWIKFFKFSKRDNSDENIIEISKDPLMNKALKALDKLSEDPIAQELSELRKKQEMDFKIINGAAFHEGKREGMAKGIEVGEEKTIFKMAKKGWAPKEIAETLEKSLAEVLGILNSKK